MQQTKEDLDVEFNIQITKTSGDTKMNVRYDGENNAIASALLYVLADLTTNYAEDVGQTTKDVISTYLRLMQENQEDVG